MQTIKMTNRGSTKNAPFPTCEILVFSVFKDVSGTSIENRIYIRGELKESLGMNFFSPFQPEREFKVYKSCKCSQIICSRVH